MSIKRHLKKYYQNQIKAQKVPEIDRIFQKEMNLEKTAHKKRQLFQTFVFYAGLTLFLVVVLSINSNTSQSLKKLDPDNQKSLYVNLQIKKGMEKVNSYFRPNPGPAK